ncbi:MAG: chemotaxis protein CheW [Geopsychrobacter sp.]|nr:chemotaxis protein CheW [Geopsychrobacter sp.]
MAITKADAATIEAEDDETINQYVTFQVADEIFGFPMGSVLEIIRLPDTVRVPLTPSALIGLANLRGSILPVLNLRTVLRLDPIEANDSTRVLVIDIGCPVGLVVDRVARVMTADPDQIDSGNHIQSGIDAELVTGVIKGKDRDPLIQLLDVKELIDQEFSSIIAAAAKNHGKADTQLQTTFSENEDEDDTDQLVSFTVEDQEYAFNLLEVEEIVRVPDIISKIPQSEAHVLGLIDLRGRLLPLVSLRRMFALNEVPLAEENRILVISIRWPGGIKHSVGLVVDDVKEVIRISKDLMDEVPKLLTEDEKESEISAICRLENGQRLVSVLRGEAMFSHPEVQAALEQTSKNKEGDAVEKENDLQEVEDDETAQLVIFKLGEQEYGVSIDAVQEITRIPDKMDKVPNTAKFIEGMVNLRGTVLPVLDMRTRFEMEKLATNDEQQRIIVLNLKGAKTGFIVDSVAEVLRLQHDQIESAPNLSAEQARIMGQVVNLKDEKRMIQVLTAQELLSDQEITEIGSKKKGAKKKSTKEE